MISELRDIVVVDDDLVLLSVLSEFLREHGYAVRIASDGFAALATIHARAPDILLSDLNMPRMSGFELLSVVRRRFPAIAVVAMSGAHAGLAASPRIAADGFYAKGSGSIFGLLETLTKIDTGEVHRSRRAVAPIWIAGLPVRQCDPAIVAVACPECLRVFSHPIGDESALVLDSCCPHCHHSLQLAVVVELEGADTARRPPSRERYHVEKSAYGY